VEDVKVRSYNVFLMVGGQSICKTASMSLLVQEDGGGQMWNITSCGWALPPVCLTSAYMIQHTCSHLRPSASKFAYCILLQSDQSKEASNGLGMTPLIW